MNKIDYSSKKRFGFMNNYYLTLLLEINNNHL